MYKLKTIESNVREILTNHPEARDDDMILYLIICKECMYRKCGRTNFTFEEVMINFRELGCPNYESVGRARRKIQASTPELGCTPKTRRKRNRGVSAYINYALDKGA